MEITLLVQKSDHVILCPWHVAFSKESSTCLAQYMKTPRMGPGPSCPPQLPLDLQLVPREKRASTVYAPLDLDRPSAHAPFPPTASQTACPASVTNPKSPKAEINRLLLKVTDSKSGPNLSVSQQASPASTQFSGGTTQNFWGNWRKLREGQGERTVNSSWPTAFTVF